MIEELYITSEQEEWFDKGVQHERRNHKCKEKIVEKVKVVKETRKDHPRSKRRQYGVVSNGQLLNPTFDTETEAANFIIGLIPANPANRSKVKLEAQVIKIW